MNTLKFKALFKQALSSVKIALCTWLLASVLIGAGYALFALYNQDYQMVLLSILVAIGALAASLPALVALFFLLPLVKRSLVSVSAKWRRLMMLLVLICFPYGIAATLIDFFSQGSISDGNPLFAGAAVIAILFSAAAIAVWLQQRAITKWLTDFQSSPAGKQHNRPSLQQLSSGISTGGTAPGIAYNFNPQIPTNMNADQPFEHHAASDIAYPAQSNSYNRNMLKAGITAVLILAMLIPANFITSLVRERQQRQQEVTDEVSSKWALPQTISTPYLCIPYHEITKNDTGKIITTRQMMFVTANDLDVKSDMQPEVRKRSIYKVLLYKSNMDMQGDMVIKSPKDIDPGNLLLNEATLCIGISDFKGIDEKIIAHFNNQDYELEPGLPDYTIDKQGLSAPVVITPGMLTAVLPFSLSMKIKGTGQLHFLPLSDNSKFEIRSDWKDPSFDGSSLPKERNINGQGFVANWSFNKANMPVLAQLLNTNAVKENLAFGVSMVQPADQYAKTNRSVKYAILFVGLTFAMFFIIELMQKKNVHPVQYVLIGLALIIFYTLLLSIGEFTGFNIAYTIAATATASLIGFYATSLFVSWKTGLVLATVIGLLYGFIYVLIQLEDTALLAGSLGLFGLLALAMYFSRRINWSNTPSKVPALAT